MRHVAFVLLCAMLSPIVATAQSRQGPGAGTGSGTGQAVTEEEVRAAAETLREAQEKLTRAIKESQAPKFSPALDNVQVELTIADQTGSGPVEKKTVSMIVAARSWGKIRASATAYQKSASTSVVPVGLNVDARPFVTSDGKIQLELTLVYNPLIPGQSNDSAQIRPTELNQSLTVILQSGKPMVVSQSADPVTDRKVTVEVKATVLK